MHDVSLLIEVVTWMDRLDTRAKTRHHVGRGGGGGGLFACLLVG